MPEVPWWSIASTLGSAVATIALAGFAAVELRAERGRRKERERSAGARIAAIAFLARRQLRSWLGPGQGSPDAFETWLRDAQNAGALARHLDIAESRFVELLALAPDAEANVATGVRSAAVHFFAGASRLNNYVATPRPNGIEIADWINLRDNAWRDFRDSIRILDDQVGMVALLREARILDARRAAETPSMEALIGRLADGLAQIHSDDEGRGGAA